MNPTSYNVIEDHSGWKPAQIQAITYKLSHLYYNWPGVVSFPLIYFGYSKYWIVIKKTHLAYEYGVAKLYRVLLFS